MSSPDGSVPRLLGLDLGRRRAGVSVSDPRGVFAEPVATLDPNEPGGLIAALAVLRDRYGAVGLVVGLPVGLDGTEGPAAAGARASGRRIADALGLALHFQDERLTTARADRELDLAGVPRSRRTGLRDRMAAQFILQAFLDARGPHP